MHYCEGILDLTSYRYKYLFPLNTWAKRIVSLVLNRIDIDSIFVMLHDGFFYWKIHLVSEIPTKQGKQCQHFICKETRKGMNNWVLQKSCRSGRKHTSFVFKTQIHKHNSTALRNGLVAIMHVNISLWSAVLQVRTSETSEQARFFTFLKFPYIAMEGWSPIPRKSCLYERSLNNHS